MRSGVNGTGDGDDGSDAAFRLLVNDGGDGGGVVTAAHVRSSPFSVESGDERMMHTWDDDGDDGDAHARVGLSSHFKEVLSVDEVHVLGQTLLRMESDFRYISAKLQGHKFIRHAKRNAALPPGVINNLLLITFVWQVANVVLYRLAFDRHYQSHNSLKVDLGVGFMLVFQVLHLIFIIVTSVKLTKQLLHRTASGWFLMQSYLSTILLFAGIYTLVYRIDANSFRGVLASGESLTHDLVFVKMLYFSTTVMSTTGFGDVSPLMWYTSLMVMVQMLLSVLYTTVIFAKGLSHFAATPAPVVPSPS